MLGNLGSQVDSRPILGTFLRGSHQGVSIIQLGVARLFPGSRKSTRSGISRRTIGIWKKEPLCQLWLSPPFRGSEGKSSCICIRSETGTNDLANPKLYSAAEYFATGCRCVLFLWKARTRCPVQVSTSEVGVIFDRSPCCPEPPFLSFPT